MSFWLRQFVKLIVGGVDKDWWVGFNSTLKLIWNLDMVAPACHPSNHEFESGIIVEFKAGQAT